MRLTRTQLTAYREETWKAQGKKCLLTGKPIALDEAVVDHCHTTGVIRGVLSRGANTMLGKIENHRRIAKLTDDVDFARFLQNLIKYIHSGRAAALDPNALLYPTHRTADEKRTLKNKRARAARAAKKVAQ